MTGRRLVSLGAACAAALTCTIGQAAPARFAVLLAANVGAADTVKLRYAHRDARKLQDVLTHLGGFPAGQVELVEQPSAEQAMAAVRRVRDRVAALPEADRRGALVFFYYSGHAERGRLLLGRQELDMKRLKEAIEAVPAAVRLAFIDACGSGEITRTKGVVRAPSIAVDAAPERARGTVIITSSAHDENSQESDDLRGSFFTHYLATGMRGDADKGPDGQVTLDEADAYAYHRTVVRTSGTRGGIQHPTYTYDLQGAGEVVLTRLGARGALEIPAAAEEGEYLVYDVERDVVVAEVDKRSRRAHRLGLRPGAYAVRLRRADGLRLQEVAVTADQVTSVDGDRFEAISYEDDITKGPAFIASAQLDRTVWSVGPRLGYQAFFDAPVRDELFHPAPLVGLRLVIDNALAPGWSVDLDWAMGGARETLPDEVGGRAVEFAVQVGGVGLARRWAWGDLAVAAGPRLGVIHLSREFPDGRDGQDLVTFTPALALGAAWRIGGGPVVAGVEARGHYLLYTADSDDRSLGFGEGWFGLAWEL